LDEQLQKAMVEVLTKAIESTDKAAHFLASELPDVAQEVLKYYFVYSFFWCFVGGIVILIPIAMLYVNYKNEWKKGGMVVLNIVVGIIGGTMGMIIISENLDWLKIWLAPKLYIIEYVSSLAS